MHLLLVRFPCLLLYHVKNVACKNNACTFLCMTSRGWMHFVMEMIHLVAYQFLQCCSVNVVVLSIAYA